MTMEEEDDLFFADLSKQIALLIMDDDDDDFPVQGPPLHGQGFHHLPQAAIPPPYAYETAYRRESKGTGVFIPRSSLPRRKKRSGKSASNNNSSHQQSSGVAVSHGTGAVNANGRPQSNYYASSTRA